MIFKAFFFWKYLCEKLGNPGNLIDLATELAEICLVWYTHFFTFTVVAFAKLDETKPIHFVTKIFWGHQSKKKDTVMVLNKQPLFHIKLPHQKCPGIRICSWYHHVFPTIFFMIYFIFKAPLNAPCICTQQNFSY